MRIVLDTNVIVSGLLSPFGAPGEIARLVSSGAVALCYDARILSEYHSVLVRPRFGFDPVRVEDLLDQIRLCGSLASPAPLKIRLPDRDDEPFLEVAVAAEADCLVTGNKRHFPAGTRRGIAVVTPKEFLKIYRSARG